MKNFKITATFIKPRTSETYQEEFGPVFGCKAANEMIKLITKKRNVISVTSHELKKAE